MLWFFPKTENIWKTIQNESHCSLQGNGSRHCDFPRGNEPPYATKALVLPYSTVIKDLKTLSQVYCRCIAIFIDAALRGDLLSPSRSTGPDGKPSPRSEELSQVILGTLKLSQTVLPPFPISHTNACIFLTYIYSTC